MGCRAPNLLAIGLALLVGGWGMTGYGKEQQHMLAQDGLPSLIWQGNDEPPLPTDAAAEEIKRRVRQAIQRYRLPGQTIYTRGIVVMALGAGLIGFGVIGHREKGAA